MSEKASPKRAFLDGLRCQSPLIPALALLLALASPLLLERLFLDWVFPRVDLRYLLRSAHDDFTHSSRELSLARAGAPGVLPVYLVGGSALRESINSPESLSGRLDAAMGKRTRVFLMASPFKNLADCLTVIENLPEGQGIAVVALNYSYFSYGLDKMALSLQGMNIFARSSRLLPFLQSESGGPLPGLRLHPFFQRLYGLDSTLPGILTYIKDYMAVNRKALAKGSLQRRQYSQHKSRFNYAWDRSRKEKQLKVWQKDRVKLFHANLEMNLRLLDLIAATASARGIRLCIVDLPMDVASIGNRLDEELNGYKPRIAELKGKYGVKVADCTRSDFSSGEFHDLAHLWDPGARSRFEGLLTSSLAEGEGR